MAWFVMGYFYDDLVTGLTSPETDSYPIDQMLCTHIADELSSVNEGDILLLEVHAHAGATFPADNAIIYKAGAPTVTFTCTGTTLNFSCKANGYSDFTDAEVQTFLDQLNSTH